MKTRCFLYLRVSGKSQIDGGGFDRQRDCMQKYCHQNDIEIVREFVELGVSGVKDSFDRPALSELFEALKTSDIKLVLVETSQRLARDLMIGEILLAQFQKIGVTVVSAECGADLSVNDGDFTKKMIRQILFAVSEFDKSMVCAKLAAARQRIKKATGKCEGRKAFGKDESERAVIALISDYSRQGMNPTDISRKLNADGIRPRTQTRAGKQTSWFPPMVSRILARQ